MSFWQYTFRTTPAMFLMLSSVLVSMVLSVALFNALTFFLNMDYTDGERLLPVEVIHVAPALISIIFMLWIAFKSIFWLFNGGSLGSFRFIPDDI